MIWISRQRGRLAAVAWLALFSIECVPAKAMKEVGTTSDPLYPIWKDADTAYDVIDKACTPDHAAPKDPAACLKAWVASKYLPNNTGSACYEFVVGVDWWRRNDNNMSRSMAAKTLATFAGADRVIAVNDTATCLSRRFPGDDERGVCSVDYTGDDIIGMAAVLVARKAKLREGYVAPVDARVRLLLGAFDDHCPATLREPSAPANCLGALAQLRADVPAFLNTLSSETLELPFGHTDKLLLRSPGCYQLATQAEAAAKARVQVAVEATLERAVGAWQAAKEAAKLHVCGEPTHSSDCEAAQSYLGLLGKYAPSSSDVGIVTTLLEGAKPKLEALSDHEAWAKTSVAECAAPISELGCQAVEQYMSQRPSGLHAAEARVALATGTPTLTKMVAKREAEEQAAEKQAEKQAADQARLVAAEEAREEARRRQEEAQRTCAITMDGRLLCWRVNGNGKIR